MTPDEINAARLIDPLARALDALEESRRECERLRTALRDIRLCLPSAEWVEVSREELEAQLAEARRDSMEGCSRVLEQRNGARVDKLVRRVAELEAEFAAERERRQFAEEAYAGAKWDSYECDRCGGADPADWGDE